MGNYYQKIKQLYSNALDSDFTIVDYSDGNGPTIKKWDVIKLGPEPTLASLDAQMTDQEAMDIVNALPNQIASEIASFPSWQQVVNAINNAFPDNAQANIIKKIARPVYTYLKQTIN